VDIARRAWLFYDVDAIREGGAATEQERQAAWAVVEKIVAFWRERGVQPEVIDSGNGYQVKVPVDLPTKTPLIKKALQAHIHQFNAPGAKIDLLHDAPRIARIPGYTNWKGDGSTERPYRTVKLLNAAAGLATEAQLQEIIASTPKEAFTAKHSSSGVTGTADLGALEIFKDAYRRRGELRDMLEVCDDVHLNGDHPTICSLANFLNNRWVDFDEDEFEIIEVLGEIWDRCGTSASGGRSPGEVEDMVRWAFSEGQETIDLGEPRELDYPKFFWSKGCSRCFYDEAEFALFKFRCEQTPAWASAAIWDGEDPTTMHWPPDYEAWKKEQPPKADDWTSMFHTKEETENAPPVTFAIEGFLQDGGVTMLGGLAGHAKTFVALAMSRSLTEGSPLFGYFQVNRISEKVVYLIPESTLAPFAHRLKKFHLNKVVGEKFFYRTLSHKSEQELLITDPKLLKFCCGADVILDTAVRFISGDENASAEQKIFAQNLFALLRAGARSVTGLHHAPKSFEKESYITLENVLRGSGDIGAMLSTCWGLRQIDKDKNRIYVANCKPRDFDPVTISSSRGVPP
jgi:hypothetical protein